MSLLNDLVSDIFEFFRDGHWHSVKDVQDRFGIDRAEAEEVIRFLAKYHLLNLNEDGSAAVIDPVVLQLLDRGTSSADLVRWSRLDGV